MLCRNMYVADSCKASLPCVFPEATGLCVGVSTFLTTVRFFSTVCKHVCSMATGL